MVDNYSGFVRDIFNDIFDGDKFPGSFGPTKSFEFVDYWTLRKRSLQLFKENPYCIGIIRRLIENEIHTGLTVESSPIASVIWPDADEAEREQQAVELYANNFDVFDYRKQQTFGEFQATVRRESLLCGDGVVVSRINPKTNLNYWDWINGNKIRTPGDYNPKGGRIIKHGVELDRHGRHVAYHVRIVTEDDVRFERIPVYGEKSGRQISWMVYGSEKMLDDVRGVPILACVLYMLKELDRYRDAESRAAVVNAMLPMYVKRAVGAGHGARVGRTLQELHDPTAGRRDGVKLGVGVEEAKDKPDLRNMEPGTIFDDLADGEEIVSFNTNRPNVNYGTFEKTIIDVVCWVLSLPPEIGKLLFTSSYSASRQANNEFEVHLKYFWTRFANDFCDLVFSETIIQMALTDFIHLPGFVPVIEDRSKWFVRAAWLKCSWMGLSRPSVDGEKDQRTAHGLINDRLSTYDQQARKLSGMSARSVWLKLARENAEMKRLGLVSAIDENNNGEPVFQNETAGAIADRVVGMLEERGLIAVNQ